MITLTNTSLWIDFTRGKSPPRYKQFVAPYLFNSSAHLAEPVVFELLRDASAREMVVLTAHYSTFPVLDTPGDLWQRAAALGRVCRTAGFSPGALKLLIASVALVHNAVLATLDEGFESIARAGGMQVKPLRRPAV